ncbi:hypothetical protein L0Z31_27050 [Burkholderia vietnamiensis]|uniref:hypothetical protein n=1 Tax=Burkholderia vietnamiensis TaxID=60552 RepID=UPI002019DB18|nr:hypothetical protein [Burkholderia vietnamiensis]MCO1351222.1 hypothetical protein [Burkholderia vietnamiensis]MCO1433575.1 hypothetical protein [Burkholderia vietnamiensis]UQN48233.1 hypothetical protein L0Y95_17290 [Burkholderia vietnamiensis]HDR9021951.1 hypothetical protein [Burkholderia vietnamiensis]HDR9260130.1 hypothetical protein [Burkholderia vietnamiensis]
MTRKRMANKPRTKAMLLPLPFALVRSISLENHLALAAMRSGHGTPDTMCALLRVLYVLFYMLDGNYDDADLSRFVDGEAVLAKSVQAVASGQDWQIVEEGISVIEAMLLRFDEVAGSVPAFRYQDSVGENGGVRTNRFAVTDTR